jgi:hypothetical protein
MSPSDLVLAVALLSAPPGTPEPIPSPDRWPAIQAAIHQVAVDWELLDPREARYVLSRVEDFECDLTILRRRHEELADAPKVAESGRFPDFDTINELIRFNRTHRKHLETRLLWETDRAELYRTAIVETDRLYRVWDAVREARGECYYVTVRRLALKRVRELIGTEAYALGELPPAVPEWRFNGVR